MSRSPTASEEYAHRWAADQCLSDFPNYIVVDQSAYLKFRRHRNYRETFINNDQRRRATMVTVLDRETQRSQSTGGRYCEGCPRCTDDPSQMCKQPHPQYQNLHPVCRRCGHCVLRGEHSDDTSDLA